MQRILVNKNKKWFNILMFTIADQDMVEIKTEGQMEIENFTTELVSGDLDLIHFPSTP